MSTIQITNTNDLLNVNSTLKSQNINTTDIDASSINTNVLNANILNVNDLNCEKIDASNINTKKLDVHEDIYINNTNYTPVGAILVYSGLTAPNGWLLCNGSEVSKENYPRLFSVIGNLYGSSSNANNFVLPDLQERIPVGKKNTTNVGDLGGNNSITLSENQLPSHNHTGTTASGGGSHSHTVSDSGHRHTYLDAYFAENTSGGSNNVFGTSANTDYDNSYKYRNNGPITDISYANISVNSTNIDHTHTFTTNSTGGGNAIDIRNKFIVLNYIIRY